MFSDFGRIFMWQTDSKMQWSWIYEGVNASVPRNAGPECASYLTMKRHCIECLLVVFICAFLLKTAIARTKPLPEIFVFHTIMPKGKNLLLISMTFTLGLELGFKLSSRSVIYILNPCHITSLIQVITFKLLLFYNHLLLNSFSTVIHNHHMIFIDYLCISVRFKLAHKFWDRVHS